MKNILISLFFLSTPLTAQVEIAFTLPEKDLIPEGLAYNPVDKSFFISSINKHKIVKIFSDGRTIDFTTPGQDGLGEVLGMKVDTIHQQLWVCSNEVVKGQSQKSMVHRYNLATAKFIQKFELTEKGHLFNDIDVSSDGKIFVTDSEGEAVYQVEDKGLKLFLKDKKFEYCNGLAFSSNGTKVFVSSFAGVYSVDVQTKKIEQLRLAGYHIFGIDGMYRYKNSLVGVQNTSFPETINQYFFDENQSRFSKAENLVASNASFDIPTTGAVASGWFYFIANSQLGNYENEKVKDINRLKEVVILRVKLL